MKINPQIIDLIDEIRNDKIHGASQRDSRSNQRWAPSAPASEANLIEMPPP